MTWYQELGVPQDATPEEIRRAYRSLVKLLHPDPHADEQVRKAAERQMCRLNEILAVLMDKAAREAYDSTLLVPPGKALVAARELGMLRQTGAWAVREWHVVFTGLVCATLLIWYFSTATHYELPRTNALRTAAQIPSPNESISQPDSREPVQSSNVHPIQTNTRSKTRDIPRTMVELSTEMALPLTVPSELKPNISYPSPSLPAVTPSLPSAESRAQTADPVSLRGTWLFVPDARDSSLRNTSQNSPAKNSNLRLEPSYIEMVITQDQPELRGRYRGRYKSSGSPVLSEIAFTFKGDIAGPFQWTAGNGVQGEGNLKLLIDESLEVNWWTTVAPREPPLMSGTSVLVRLRSR